MEISQEVMALLPEVTAYRRALHRIPEEGTKEFKTQAFLRKSLEALSPDSLEVFADTGLRAVFKKSAGSQTGERAEERVIGFRADMDGLCVKEPEGFDFASGHEGFMHACGHDGHMAALLGLALLISRNRDRLLDDVVLLFQPAEESVGGASRMIDEGALKNPDIGMMFGMHIMPDIPMGGIGVREGPLMAQTCEFDIHIEGKSAHGAMPHLGVDAIAAAAHLYTMLQTSVTRTIDPFENALITVGRLTAGERRNIIARSALLECTARSFDEGIYGILRRNILNDMAGLEIAFGVRTTFVEHTYYPPVINPPGLTERVIRTAGKRYVPVKPKMIAEDFACFQRVVPAVYFFCGSGTVAFDAPLHSANFGFDEKALLYGIEVFLRQIDINFTDN